jgi:uncharacterized protein (TIGR02145 family)
MHGHVGNYYNWTAAIASNDSSSYTSDTSTDTSDNPQNSICPAGWRLPVANGSPDEYSELTDLYDNTINDEGFTTDPLYFVRGGYIEDDSLFFSGDVGLYWSSTVQDGGYAYSPRFTSTGVSTGWYMERYDGISVRCVAR